MKKEQRGTKKNPRKVYYAVLYKGKKENAKYDFDVVMQDGGIAYFHCDSDVPNTMYGSSRITLDMKIDKIYEGSDDGGIDFDSYKEWDNKECADEEVIMDMVNWLYMSTDVVEFVRLPYNRLTKANLEKIITEFD